MKILFCLIAAIYWHAGSAKPPSNVYRVANGSETLRNLLVTEVGSLVLGSNFALRRLDAHLDMLQTVYLPEGQPNRLLVNDPDGTYNGSFMSCTRTACELLDVENITRQLWMSSDVLLDGTLNVLGLFVPGPDGNSVFTALLPNDFDTIRASTIRRGRVVGSSNNQDFMILAFQAESTPFVMREFLTAFQHQGFSYYVVIDSIVQTRVVRICNNDTTAFTAFDSYFEIQLECGTYYGIAVPTAATFVSLDSTIAVSVATDTENLLCVYELSQINQLMFDKYNSCRYGEGVAGLARQMTFNCVLFDEDRLNNPVMLVSVIIIHKQLMPKTLQANASIMCD